VVLLYPRRGAETPIGGSSSLEHLPANSPAVQHNVTGHGVVLEITGWK
jgi:hypothetical protein